MNEDGLLSSAGAALLPSAALDEPLEGSALEDAVEAFDATALTNAVDTYENLVIDAQAAVDGAISALSGARALDFGAAASAFTSAGDITASAAQTAASAVVSAAALDVASGDNLTDANINAALTAARAEIDGTNYYALNTTGTAYEAATAGVSGSVTAKELQSALIAAESTLNADRTANGSDVDVLSSLRQAITDYANNGGDLDVTITGGSAANNGSASPIATGSASYDLGTVLTAINGALTSTADASDDLALIQALQGAASGTTGDPMSLAASATGATATLRDAIDSALSDIDNRADNLDAVGVAEENFKDTAEGTLLAHAETLAAWREAQKQAITDAQGDLTEAENLEATIKAFEADYDQAVSDVEAAEQAFEDAGIELPVELTGTLAATAEDDVYLFQEDEGSVATISNFGAEGNDVIFVGSEFTLTPLAEDADLAGDRTGSFDTLEVFVQQTGTGTSLFFETEAAAGSDEASATTDGFTQVTLIGVNAEDVSMNSEGFITVA